MRAGSQAHDEDARIRIAESWYRFAPVLPVAIGAALLARDLLAVGNEAGAARATDHFAIENREPGHLAITSQRGDVFIPPTFDELTIGEEAETPPLSRKKGGTRMGHPAIRRHNDGSIAETSPDSRRRRS